MKLKIENKEIFGNKMKSGNVLVTKCGICYLIILNNTEIGKKYQLVDLSDGYVFGVSLDSYVDLKYSYPDIYKAVIDVKTTSDFDLVLIEEDNYEE